MKSRALVAMMLVGAFLVAPSATADSLSVPVELPSELEAPTNPVDNRVGPVGNVDLDMVTGLLDCQMAVRVPVAVFGGNIVDTRDNHLDVIMTVETVLDTVTREVPVMGTVREVVWQPSGLLSSLPPIVRDVTAVVGYKEEIIPADAADLDYNIVLDWRDSKIDWHQMDFEILLALPAGLPLASQGFGSVVTACEGEDILPRLPDFSELYGEYEFIKVSIGGSDRGDHSRWYAHILNVEVSLADADDANKPHYNNWGLMIAPGEAVDAAQADLADLQAAILRGDVSIFESHVTGTPTPAPVAPASAQTVVSQTSLMAAVAGVLGSLGAAFGLRRLF